MKLLNIIKFCIFICLIIVKLNAWVVGYEPSSCFSVPTANNINLSNLGNTSFTCNSNISLFQGIRISESDCIDNNDGSGATGGIYTINNTYIRLRVGVASNGAAQTHSASYYIRMPSENGPYLFYTATYSTGNYFGNITMNSNAYGNLTLINSTHVNMSIYGGGSEIYSVGQEVPIQLTAGCSGTCNSYSEIQLPNWNVTTPLKLNPYNGNCNLTNSYSYISANPGYSSLIADMNTLGYKERVANITTKCKATIFYETTILKPKITFAPGYWAFPDFYNHTSLVSYLENGTVNLIYDTSSQVWFEVPLVTCDDFTTVTAVAAYIYPYSGGGIGEIPLTYLIQNCYDNTTHYIWNIKGQTASNFYVNQTWNNSSSYYYTYSGLVFNGSLLLANTTNITIGDESRVLCAWQNGSGVFTNTNAFLGSFSLLDWFSKIFLIMMAGISFVVPFGAFGFLFFNDIFGWLDLGSAFMVSVILLIISMLAHSRTSSSLKHVGLYFAIGLGILIYYSSASGLLGDISTITDAGGSLQTNMQNVLTAIVSFDLAGFFIGTIGVLIDMFRFIISIPTYLLTGILAPIASINLNLYNAVSAFSSVITFGLVFWLIYTIYQIASNKYQNL